jgi:magnesium transporter
MEVLTQVDRGRIEALRARDEFFWLDLAAPSAADLAAIGPLLGLHELALEDTREMGQRPKLDRYDDAVLLVFWSAQVRDATPEPCEVHLHIAGGYLLTARPDPGGPLDGLHGVTDFGPHGEQDVVYRVLDALTDALFPVIDCFETRIDALEEAVLASPDEHQLGEIYRLKQAVQGMLRRLVPQRDQFGPASEAIMALPGLTGSREHWRDIGDHLAQVTAELYRQTDDLGALTSTYFSANANRLNKLATRLTVIATFFLIWSSVSSFFGQNFGWLVRHTESFGSFVLWESVGLVLPTLLIAAYFWRRRREWL